jgi:hypothetical protein
MASRVYPGTSRLVTGRDLATSQSLIYRPAGMDIFKEERIMPRYKLKDKCLFVDAYKLDNLDSNNPDRKDFQDIPYAYVMDKRTGHPYTVTPFNDVAAFIARFIAMGVDTGLIPQILTSEYGPAMANPQGEVNKVVSMLQNYLDPLQANPRRTYHAADFLTIAGNTGPHPHLTDRVGVDFKINWLGGGVFKGPL